MSFYTHLQLERDKLIAEIKRVESEFKNLPSDAKEAKYALLKTTIALRTEVLEIQKEILSSMTSDDENFYPLYSRSRRY